MDQVSSRLRKGARAVAKILYTHINPTSKKDISETCRILARDGVIAYPTDVNWAFGCSPFSKRGLEKIRALKPSHPKEQPFSLLCNNLSMIGTYAELDNLGFRVLRRIFPGPFTVLLRRGRSFPKQLKDRRTEVGVRVPNSPLLLDLITELGHPLATTSLPNKMPQSKKRREEGPLQYGFEVEECYGHALDLILDLGSPVPAMETTILDLSQGEVKVLREGSDKSLIEPIAGV